MTVGELIEILQRWPKDTPVVVCRNGHHHDADRVVERLLGRRAGGGVYPKFRNLADRNVVKAAIIE